MVCCLFRGLNPFKIVTGQIVTGRLAVALVFGLGLGGTPSPAVAGCADPPSQGVNWQRCILDGLALKEVDLSGARLRDASFFRSDLSASDLTNVSGFRAKFVNAKLAGVRFDGAELAEGDFTKADLTGASFKDADLRRARFYRAILKNADLTGARFEGADFARANLSGAIWIDGEHICAEGSLGRCN